MMRLSVSVILMSVMTHPQVAQACAVCGSQEEKAAGTYLAMTLFLSLLPLSLMAGVGYMIWRGVQVAEMEEAQQSLPHWKDVVLRPPNPEEPISLPDPSSGLTT